MLSAQEARMQERFCKYNWMVFGGDPTKQEERPEHIEPKCESCHVKYPYRDNPTHMGGYPGHQATPRHLVKPGGRAEAIAASNIVRLIPEIVVSA